jgi:hypothetical protein
MSQKTCRCLFLFFAFGKNGKDEYNTRVFSFLSFEESRQINLLFRLGAKYLSCWLNM